MDGRIHAVTVDYSWLSPGAYIGSPSGGHSVIVEVVDHDVELL